MFIAVLVGLFSLKYYKDTPNRCFIYFLVYAYVVSVTMTYTRYVYKYEFLFHLRDYLESTFFEKNNWLSTIFWRIGATLFILYIYFKYLHNKLFKRVILLIGVLFLTLSILVILMDLSKLPSGYYNFHQVGSMSCILSCVGFYFIELIQSDRILKFNRSLLFYVSCTFLFWYLIVNSTVFYQSYFTTSDWPYVYLRNNIYLVANILMYSMFTFALLWCKPQTDQ